jgi:polyisoprenyl-phosphate glycosyltransferase
LSAVNECMARFDIIIPVFNEGPALERFHASLNAATCTLPQHTFRFLYVNDGSSDDTPAVLDRMTAADPRIFAIELSRNFGHQAAISAGLDAFDADALIMMDGDGEHPPHLVPEMIGLFEAGYDIVQTQRIDRERKGFFLKRISSAVFYGLINRMGETHVVSGAADFRLLSRDAADALRRLPEYHRFYRAMVQWIGFRSVILPFAPAQRIEGRSKYSLSKMLRLAQDGMFSFSQAPLRLGFLIGTVFLLLAATEIVYILSFWIRGETSKLVPGWSSVMMVLTISSATTMFLMGILGFYVGMIFEEVKRRPVYLSRKLRAGSPALLSRKGDAVPPSSVNQP